MIFFRHIVIKTFGTLGKLLAVACLTLASLPAYAQEQETVWFVVSEGPNVQSHHGDSFLLPLSEPAHIARARQLIDEGPGDAVITTIAKISIGGDGLNRDTFLDEELAWSWQVTDVVRFAENIISGGTCTAWPTGLELGITVAQANNCTTVNFAGYVPVAELEEPPAFFISEGLNGTWYYPPTSGQGVTVDVLAERGQVFLAWVTYAAGGPTGRPADEQAWITAHGTFEGNAATLDAFVTTGGAFDSPAPVTTRPIGQIELAFSDCNHGVLRYAFDDGQSGEFPIIRIISLPGCVSRLADLRRRDEAN